MKLHHTVCSFILALNISAPSTAQPQNSHPKPNIQMAELAQQLLTHIPANHKQPWRIALRPFTQSHIIARPMVEQYHQQLQSALNQQAASKSNLTMVVREQIDQLTREQQEFSSATVDLTRYQADYLIIPEISPITAGVRLSLQLIHHDSGQIIADRLSDLPATHQNLHSWQLQQAIAEYGERLFEYASTRLGQLAQPQLNLLPVNHTESGQSSRFGTHLAQQVAVHLRDSLQRQQHKRERDMALKGEGAALHTAATTISLSGTVRDLGENLSATLQLEQGDKREVLSTHTLLIRKSTIPPRLLPVTTAAVEDRQGRWQARGEAITSDQISRDTALQMARNVARARMVAQYLSESSPVDGVARTTADSQHAITRLSHAIPSDEQWLNRHSAENSRGSHLTVQLQAKITPTASVQQQPLRATLTSSSYLQQGEPITLAISGARTRLYLGIYGWFGDNQVVRLYPYDAYPQLEVGEGETLNLPFEEEMPLQSAPRPGLEKEHEALIIVAAPQPINFEQLAPALGESAAESREIAHDITHFFDRLAAEKLNRMRVIFLPYEIRS